MTNIEMWQAELAKINRQLLDLAAGVHPDYSEDGTSVSLNAWADSLHRRRMELMEIPGVAPEMHPVFTVFS